MKPYKILLFIFMCFVSLAILGSVFPREGVQLGNLVLRFPLPTSIVSQEKENNIDLDETVHNLQEKQNLQTIKSTIDSLKYYKDYVYNDITRIHFPHNNYKFFDKLFEVLDNSKNSDVTTIIHYGDSQIEMDRISSLLRQRLQERFGGMGAGILPPIQTIPSFTIVQTYSGNLQRYVVYGDTSQPRANHRRYGLMGTFAQLYDNAIITVRTSSGKRTQEYAKTFQQAHLIVGNNQGKFTAICRNQTRTINTTKKGVTVLKWDFNDPISQATFTFSGVGEIYGISLSGKNGVTLSNVPMRGGSGTIFTRIDSALLAQSYQAMNVALIIMQYGGNMMPQINSDKAIESYMRNIAKQIQYLKRVNPKAEILFIGPSDMAKRIDGQIQTYTYLPKMNDALKEIVLKNGAAYWDLFNVMGGRNSMIQWVKHSPPWAGPDYIHFTEIGALEIASILSNSLLIHHDFYQLRKRQNPAIIEKFMQLD